MAIDEIYIKRCLELASISEGLTSPNPLVGAVIEYDGKIIAEGKHAFYGAPHAEPDAISKVKNVELLKKCTLYVNLEPCCHHGKTPPCTEKIIASGIPRVVVAAKDTSEKVNGRGIEILRSAGIDVKVCVLEKEARHLNRFFYTYHEKKRPHIILKWAQTLDGFIDSDRQTGDIPPARISNSLTQILDHRWRSACQAVMVGKNTVIMDNPNLTVRRWYGKNPLRITIDRNGELDSELYNFFNSQAKSLIFSPKTGYGKNAETSKFTALEDIVAELYRRRIQSLTVEGGTKLIESFIACQLWDEAKIFKGNLNLGKGVKAPVICGKTVSEESLGSDTVISIENY
ncbi:MAG: bifunctional diaminohydroxyphosphoribosylaminopyrimidine deaminase/5-amino-6-(5-phosphoribosylamino)uracil reductase RibD [Prevotellaceae bacterium]|jgi:diaminohydroxyphosphoribosylaminopyrimidine deaminase/5-amino-6-(5-phosphoribosylamino)uracil reductase|nr:bifunctional diaminohydroxyphosphoribosylaminopyrimidine deaminase/5-amino-6-(5-phosphoribosylamino)uracil reductase RibD [Prevotellaceae bacterium]